VACDRLAKKQFVQTSTTTSTEIHTPEFEAAQPHLLIQGQVICRRFIHTLRMATSAPEYWQYLKKKQNWTQLDIQNIHWPIFHSALNSLQSNDQRQMILFIHGKLPLRASKFHPHLGFPLCPSCKCEHEDAQHFLACQHIDCRNHFEKLKRQLMAITVKYALHPSILTCFWLGLVTTHNATQYPEVIEELPRELCSTVCYQQRLGWDQLYYGRIARQWARAIDDLHPHLAISRQQVLKKFVQTVWAYVLATWSTRNQQLHNDAGQLSLPDYQQAVTMLYEMSQQLPPDAQAALFRRPLQEMLDQPPAVLCPLVE